MTRRTDSCARPGVAPRGDRTAGVSVACPRVSDGISSVMSLLEADRSDPDLRGALLCLDHDALIGRGPQSPLTTISDAPAAELGLVAPPLTPALRDYLERLSDEIAAPVPTGVSLTIGGVVYSIADARYQHKSTTNTLTGRARTLHADGEPLARAAVNGWNNRATITDAMWAHLAAHRIAIVRGFLARALQYVTVDALAVDLLHFMGAPVPEPEEPMLAPPSHVIAESALRVRDELTRMASGKTLETEGYAWTAAASARLLSELDDHVVVFGPALPTIRRTRSLLTQCREGLEHLAEATGANRTDGTDLTIARMTQALEAVDTIFRELQPATAFASYRSTCEWGQSMACHALGAAGVIINTALATEQLPLSIETEGRERVYTVRITEGDRTFCAQGAGYPGTSFRGALPWIDGPRVVFSGERRRTLGATDRGPTAEDYWQLLSDGWLLAQRLVPTARKRLLGDSGANLLGGSGDIRLLE